MNDNSINFIKPEEPLIIETVDSTIYRRGYKYTFKWWLLVKTSSLLIKSHDISILNNLLEAVKN